MSFDSGLEKGFRGMFSKKKDKIHQKLTEWHHSGRREALERSSDESEYPPAASPTGSSGGSPEDSPKPSITPRHPSEEGRTRFVYRWWPRNPNGPNIDYVAEGKKAPNGITVWGATMHDFFRTNRVPTVPNLVLTSSGSRLAAFVRKVGEEEWAQDELSWADDEDDPEEKFPCDIAKLIQTGDSRMGMRLGIDSKRSLPREKVEFDQTRVDPTQPFKISNYPPPYPLVPFTSKSVHPLQARLPLHLLPEKIVVHDPWNTLQVRVREEQELEQEPEQESEQDLESDQEPRIAKPLQRWEDRPDIVRTYNLSLSPDSLSKRDKERKDALDSWEAKCKEETILRHTFPVDADGFTDPPVLFPAPPPPRPVVEVPEAHLYISPGAAIGRGNHSFVYSVEWELPRSVFFEPVMCQICIAEAVDAALDAKGLRQAGKGNEGRGKITVEKKMVRPGVDVEFMSPEERGIDRASSSGKNTPDPNAKPPPPPPQNEARTHEYRDPEYEVIHHYEGPAHKLEREELKVEYNHPHTGGPSCTHLRSGPYHPSPITARVRVAAKLSIQGDSHLAHEALNYQNFPDHFFQHWSGFNLVPPLHDPVPVGAVVPQFYGYYVPDEEEMKKVDGEYLSPILLLEDCGRPIELDGLGYDDRAECASLFLRMQCAGWLHNSVAPRNILMARGSIFDWPISKSSAYHRFRLIDFGRSEKYEVPEKYKDEPYYDRMEGWGNTGGRMSEESQIRMMFGFL